MWTTGLATGHEKGTSNTLVYERRIGARSQFEAVVPIDLRRNYDQGPDGRWIGGVGDVALAFRHTFLASSRTGPIAAAGGEVALPTGNELKDLGSGYAVYEPFAMLGQALPRNSYFQVHGGFEFPGHWPGQK